LNKIISKIQNLLELAYDSPSDEEGQTALLMAQKLMLKHKISLAQVESKKEETHSFNEASGKTAGRILWWESSLAALLAKNFRCHAIRNRNSAARETSINFFGLEEDAELCSEIFNATRLYLMYRFKRLVGKEKKNSYLSGFLLGLDERFEKQILEKQEYALVVQVPAVVEQEFKRQYGNLRNHNSKKPDFDLDVEAYFEGYYHAKESIIMPNELLRE
jgi:hypothetical protein